MRGITANVVAVKSAAVEFLRAKLDDTGMSQTELAKLAGLERSHISEMLAGRLARFSLSRINQALAVFNAEIETSYPAVARYQPRSALIASSSVPQALPPGFLPLLVPPRGRLKWRRSSGQPAWPMSE
jgi:predicted XRE-type DNA-binding protein